MDNFYFIRLVDGRVLFFDRNKTIISPHTVLCSFNKEYVIRILGVVINRLHTLHDLMHDYPYFFAAPYWFSKGETIELCLQNLQ